MNTHFFPNPHQPGCFWHSLTEKFGAPNIKWCEETLCQIVSEPANAVSNIGYILIGLYFCYQWRNHQLSFMRKLPIFELIMGMCSLFYHMSNFFISQIFDFIGMYLFLICIISTNFYRLKLIEEKNILPLVYGLSFLLTVLILPLYRSNIPYQPIVGILVIFILGSEILLMMKRNFGIPLNYQSFFTSLIFATLGVIASHLDLNRIWCDPTNHWLQGHALWHYFCAFMGYFLLKHYEQIFPLRNSNEEIPPLI